MNHLRETNLRSVFYCITRNFEYKRAIYLQALRGITDIFGILSRTDYPPRIQ